MSEDLDDIVENLREPSAWIRVLFMVGFALVLHLIVGPIIIVLMIVQALFKLITSETNFNLRRFGKALGQWVYEVIQFLTYNSQEKPFPFSDFPPLEDEEESGEGQGKDSKSKKASSKATTDETDSTKVEQDSEAAGSSARKKSAAKKSTGKKKSASSSARKKTAAKKSSSKKADSKDSGKGDSADKAQDDKAGDDKSEA